CTVGQLKKMRMGAIAVCKDGKSELSVTISEQKGRVPAKAAAMGEITVTISDLRPPRQAETGGLVSPDALDAALELVVLTSEHLFHRLLADHSLAFKHADVEIE